jgi:hypothetical protein
MYLARNANDSDALVPGSPRWLKQRQQGRISHPHAAGMAHVVRVGNDHRHRPPLVLRIRHHGQHRINPSRTQQPFANGSRNAGPLRAVHRRAHARAHHPPERSEVQLVLPARIARTAMHAFFQQPDSPA